MMETYVEAVAHLRTFAAMFMGMGMAFLFCQMVQPQPRYFGVAMAAALFLFAWWLVQYGPDVLLVKPTGEV